MAAPINPQRGPRAAMRVRIQAVAFRTGEVTLQILHVDPVSPEPRDN